MLKYKGYYASVEFDEDGGVLHGDADGFEERDFLIRATARMKTVDDFPQVCNDVVAIDQSCLQRLDEVARFFPGSVAVIDNDDRARDRFPRNLADVRLIGTDGVDVRSRLQIGVVEDRFLRRRRGTDDIGVGDGFLRGCRSTEILRDRSATGAFGDQVIDFAASSGIDPCGPDLTHRADGLEMRPTLHAGTEDRDRAAVRPCEQIRRRSGSRRRTDTGERRPFQTSSRLPGCCVEDKDCRLNPCQTTFRIPVEDGDNFHRKRLFAARIAVSIPRQQRRHDECDSRMIGDRNVRPQRHSRSPVRQRGKRRFHRRNRGLHGEGFANIGGAEN